MPVDRPPTADRNSIEVNRDVATTITLSVRDVDGDPFTFTIVGNSSLLTAVSDASS